MQNEEKESREIKKIRCRYCDSSFGYVRIKDNTWVCRNCGEIENLNEDSNEKEE